MGQLKDFLDEAYAIATGSCAFAAMKIKGNAQTIVAKLADISAADTKLKLQQSVTGGENDWADVPGSEQTLVALQTSHTWNVTGYPSGMLLRVYLTAGTDEAGSVNQIKMLSDE